MDYIRLVEGVLRSQFVLTRTRTILLLGGFQHDTRTRIEPSIKLLGYFLQVVENAAAMQLVLQRSQDEIAAVLVESIAGDDLCDMVRAVRVIDAQLPVFVILTDASIQSVVAVMKWGATDVLGLPLTPESLAGCMTRALVTTAQKRELPSPRHDETDFFMGLNPRMGEIFRLVNQIGKAKVPVLIQGETGTGKEVIARAIHSRSSRANRPFLKLNCAALPSELVESELFGYERGAFTGAFKRKEGMFELADGGTLLLDEIGDMEVRLQAKLLQVLQDKEFRRIGGKEAVRVDVRIIAATHRNLEQAMEDRSFREDLFYRLNVVNLVVPPLRERKDDIIPTAEFLIRKHAAQEASAPVMSLDLREAMLAYNWPGNVRELENCVRKLMIFRDSALIARDLWARASRKPTDTLCIVTGKLEASHKSYNVSALDEAARAKQKADADVIVAALNATRWNRKQAAAMLNIDYKSLLYKMKKLKIESGSTELLDPPDLSLLRTRSANGD